LRSVAESYRGSHVRVFRLNRQAVLARLDARARRLLADEPQAREVWLFGSLARGEAGPRSDADLLVVLETSPLPFLDRCASLARYFEGVGLACDVLAYTRMELDSLRQEGAALPRQVEAEGRILARRGLPER
jgi:predicted nucleotidyltransferase